MGANRTVIERHLIYRHFASKEEVFALTTTRYLAEIKALLEVVDERTGGAAAPRIRGDC